MDQTDSRWWCEIGEPHAQRLIFKKEGSLCLREEQVGRDLHSSSCFRLRAG